MKRAISIMFFLFIVITLQGCNKQEAVTISGGSQEAVEIEKSIEQEQGTQNVKALEETFVMDDFEISVFSCDFKTEIYSDDFSSFKADVGDQYLMVKASVKNIGTSVKTFLNTFTVSSNDLTATVMYADKYEYISTELFAYNEGLKGALVRPLTSKDGYIAFLVPDEVAESAKPLSIVFSFGEQQVIVELERPQEIERELSFEKEPKELIETTIDWQTFSKSYDDIGIPEGSVWELPEPVHVEDALLYRMTNKLGWVTEIYCSKKTNNLYYIKIIYGGDSTASKLQDFDEGVSYQSWAFMSALLSSLTEEDLENKSSNVWLSELDSLRILVFDEDIQSVKQKVINAQNNPIDEIYLGLHITRDFLDEGEGKIVIIIQNSDLKDTFPRESSSATTQEKETGGVVPEVPMKHEENTVYSNDVSPEPSKDRFALADWDSGTEHSESYESITGLENEAINSYTMG